MGSPSGRVPEQGPDWFLVATEACGGGTPDLSYVLEVLGYKSIYGCRGYVRGTTGGTHEVGGRAPYVVSSSKLLLRRVQVSWIMFVPKITLPKVSFRLDSV